MIGVSTLQFDPFGAFLFRELPGTDYGAVTRRVHRAPTLNGGVAINDLGSSVGDQTLRLRWRIESHAQLREVQRLVRFSRRVLVSTRDGIFEAVPASAENDEGVGVLTLLLTREK